MPGTLLHCCHGEVIVVILLATGYLGEHQTAQPGPVSNGPGAVAAPTVPCPPSPFTPLLLTRGSILSCAQRRYRWPFAQGRGYPWPFSTSDLQKYGQPRAVMPTLSTTTKM